MFTADWIRVAAAGAAGAIFVTALPSIASAAEDQWSTMQYFLMSRSTVCIESLTVHESADWDGDDTYLAVNGLMIWESPSPMGNESTAPVNQTVPLGEVVEAWDRDWPDSNDFIGRDKVDSDESGSAEGTLTFRDDYAHYSARFTQGAC